MKTNPGGQLVSSNVIGRDLLIRKLWAALEQQSVVMTAERRIGKTSVLQKMQAEPPTGWTPVFQDLEGFASATDFATSVYRTVQRHLSSKNRLAQRANELLNSLGGAEVGGMITLKLPQQAEVKWQDLLMRSVEDLVNEQPKGSRLLFLWDEMPYMLTNIRNGEGEETALQILNVLRSLRQTHRGFRMLMTGSIGLHHVLTSLERRADAKAGLNDMYDVEVPPLEPFYAQELTRKLFEGERLEVTDLDATAREVARVSDGFPFYIHYIVRALKDEGGTVEPGRVESAVEKQLTDASDPWELRHYRDRLSSYYGADEETVLYLLDELAVREEPAGARALLAHLKTLGSYDDLEHVRALLTRLAQDHYLVRGADGYRFRFTLIQHWWRLERELGDGAPA